jgi:CarD family transcriptional regulator
MSSLKKGLQFSVGDKVMVPRHGIGTIVGAEDGRLAEELGPHYAVEFPEQRLLVRFPAREVEALGVRVIMHPNEVGQVLRVLRSQPSSLPEHAGTRHKQIHAKLEEGDPARTAAAVRDLAFHVRTEHHTKVDSDLLERGREFLVSEIAEVTGWEFSDVVKSVDSALESALVMAGAEGP